MSRDKRIATAVLILSTSVPASAQKPLPVIDMHLHASAADENGPPPLALCVPPEEHAVGDPRRSWGEIFIQAQKKPPCADPVWSPETDDALMRATIDVLERRNVIGILSGTPERVQQWMNAAPDRFIPGLQFRFGRETLTPGSLRRLYTERRFAVFAEVTNQYVGIAASDPRFEPYLATAEELDIPVGIHVGTGPPGAPLSRARAIPGRSAQPALKRVMFGSDQMVWPGVIARSIQAIESAPFLSEAQKRDILYNNAARFLRLGDAEIARHHGR